MRTFIYTSFQKRLGLLAKIQVTPQDRNRYGVQGEGKISPRVELLHRYVNQKVRSCRTANGGSTFGSELASSQNKKEIRELQKQVLDRVQASLGLRRRSSVYPALRPEGASSYGFLGITPKIQWPLGAQVPCHWCRILQRQIAMYVVNTWHSQPTLLHPGMKSTRPGTVFVKLGSGEVL